MAIKVKIAKPTWKRPAKSSILFVLLIVCACIALVGFIAFSVLYIKYRGIVDERLKQPIFANTAKIYAAPREVRPGQKLTVHWIANELRDGRLKEVSPTGILGDPTAASLGEGRALLDMLSIQLCDLVDSRFPR